MKSFLDFFPIILFFGAYKMGDIYSATGVLMAATVVQMVLVYRLDGRLQTMHKVTLGLVLVFGALTLGLHDERFIKWKPTVLYTGMALALAVSQRFFNKNFLQSMLGQQLKLPAPVWRRLNLSWVLYSLFMASINAYVALYFSTEEWVDFKIWGYVFPILFLIGQGLYVARHLPQTDGSA
jgi:intracellular septation protein